MAHGAGSGWKGCEGGEKERVRRWGLTLNELARGLHPGLTHSETGWDSRNVRSYGTLFLVALLIQSLNCCLSVTPTRLYFSVFALATVVLFSYCFSLPKCLKSLLPYGKLGYRHG